MALCLLPERFVVPNSSERTAERFMTIDWGVKSGLAPDQMSWAMAEAKRDYPDVQARNYDHGTDALWCGNIVADCHDISFANQPNIPKINRKLLDLALLLHDIRPLESESAELYAHYARRLGFSGTEITDGAGIILSSAQNVEAKSREEQAMNISDIHTVGEPWESFEARGKAYLKEDEQTQSGGNRAHYLAENAERLAHFAIKDLRLDGVAAVWYEHMQLNVRTFITKVAFEEFGQNPFQFANEHNYEVINKLFGGKLLEIVQQRPVAAT